MSDALSTIKVLTLKSNDALRERALKLSDEIFECWLEYGPVVEEYQAIVEELSSRGVWL